MQRTANEILSEVFARCAEHFAHMFTETPAQGADTAVSEPCILAWVAFKGPAPGRLGLILPQSLASRIAAAAMALDPGDARADELADDAVREFVGMIGGSFVNGQHGEELVFDLAVPESRRIGAKSWDDVQNAPGAITLLLDERPVVLQLALQD